ncbi:MAG: type II toxin-antitoxin system VapC family toxin [Granulosicoccus sp.]
MQVLVDASVWIDHFRSDNTVLRRLLENDQVCIHPLVIGELACGTPPDRKMTLMYLKHLSSVQIATSAETLDFIEQNDLFGTGCGWVDVSLLASCLLTTGCELWTLNKRLVKHSIRYGIQFQSS